MKPILPEILTPNNTLDINWVNNGNGTVTISLLQNQMIRIQDAVISTTNRNDIYFTVPIPTTVGQTDTYHIRYSLNGSSINIFTPNPNSFYIVNLLNTSYNPSSAPEDDIQFDSKYDDILIARVDVSDTGTVNILSYKNSNKKEVLYYSTNKTSVSLSLPVAGTWYDLPIQTLTVPKRGNYVLHFAHRAWYDNTADWCKFRVLRNSTEIEQFFHSNLNNTGVEHADHTGAGSTYFHANQGDIVKIQALSSTSNATLWLSDINGSTTVTLQEV